MQNKNEAATLIKRFWNKLVNCVNNTESSEPEVVPEVLAPVVEKPPVERENRNRNNNNRRDKNKNRERNNHQERGNNQEQGVVQNQEPRPNRPMRGPGRNVRPNLVPSVASTSETANDTTVINAALPIAVSDVVRNVPREQETEFQVTEVVVEINVDHTAPKPERKNNNRRGPNRRRPRNPNYKKPETDGDSPVFHSDEVPHTENYEQSEPRPAPVRSYNSEFAERIEKIDRPEATVHADVNKTEFNAE